jgi:hypothetical protein
VDIASLKTKPRPQAIAVPTGDNFEKYRTTARKKELEADDLSYNPWRRLRRRNCFYGFKGGSGDQ